MARRERAAAIAGVLLVPSIAGAEGSARAPDAALLEYETVTGCPGEREFIEKVNARTTHVEIAAGGAHRTGVTVRITRRQAAHPLHGELVVRYSDGAEATRTIDGDACESVVDALALMSAITLDRTATASSPNGQPEPATGSLEGAPPTAAGGTETGRAGPTVSLGQAARSETTPSGVAQDVDLGLHVAGGAGGGAVFGIAPVAAPSAMAFVEVGWTTNQVWSPTVRVLFDYATSATTPEGAGSVQLSQMELGLDGCPLRLVTSAWRFVPCAHLEGGALSATGSGVTPERPAVRPWLAAGLLGVVQYRLGPRFFAEVTGGVNVPLVRDRFFFEPDATYTVFRAPIVSGFLGGGVGVTIL